MELQIQVLPYLPEESAPGEIVAYLAVHKSEEGLLRSGRILCLNYSSFPYRISTSEGGQGVLVKKEQGVTIGAFSASELQEQPTVSLYCWREGKRGTVEPLKLKVLRKKLLQDHFYYAALNMFLCPLDAYAPGKKVKKEDLRKYAEQLRQAEVRRMDTVSANDIMERAEFNTKLDLHARAIVDDPGEYRGDEIFALQIETFERYMDRAIRLGVERVEIIHGIGTGRLRKELSQRLRGYREVSNFRNEYTKDHKFGATIVEFR